MMPLVNLTISEFKRALQIFFWLSVAVSAPIVLVRHYALESSLLAALSSIPLAVGIALGVTLFVLRRPLKASWLAKALGRQQVHGLWFGHLTSNYGTDRGRPEMVIPAAFVIRQTYLGYSLTSYTATQDGYSQVESLTHDLKASQFVLTYVFELRRLYRGENKLTQGSGVLRLTSEGRRLVGFYWTNSPTQGQVDLKLVTRECDHIDNFADAERLLRQAQAVPLAVSAGSKAG